MLPNRDRLISIHQMFHPSEEFAKSVIENLVVMVYPHTRKGNSHFFCPEEDPLLTLCGKTNESSGPELLEATRGRYFGVARKILEQEPDSIKEVTPKTKETALHVDVRNGDLYMVEVLLWHLRGKCYYSSVIDMIDAGGLRFAVVRKQLQTIQMLSENGPADRLMLLVNAKNGSGYRALDILYVLTEKGEVDMEIEITLRRAGAFSAREEAIRLMLVNAKISSGFRDLDILLDVLTESGEVDMEIEKNLRKAGALSAGEEASRLMLINAKISSGFRDLDMLLDHETKLIEQKFDWNKQEVRIEFDKFVVPPYSVSQGKTFGLLLIVATMIAAMTFHAALNPRRIIPFNVLKEEESFWNHLFVLFNSVAFFTALAFITVLTHELPFKPWLHISVFSAIGAYICVVMAVSPQEVATVIFTGIFVFFGAVGNLLKLHKKIIYIIKWVVARITPFSRAKDGFVRFVDLKRV